jgi:hypothetical protein
MSKLFRTVSLDLISKHFKTCPAEGKGLVKSKGAAIMESKNLKGKLVAPKS